MLKKIKRLARIKFGFDPEIREQIQIQTEHHGSDNAGWTIAPLGLNNKSIIYSFGIGEDISFDISLVNKYQVNIYAFDPTPKSLRWVRSRKIPSQIKIFPWGIASHDGMADFLPPNNPNFVSFKMDKSCRNVDKKKSQNLPVLKLKTIMGKLKHKKIDLLKLDIEGAEYKVLNDLLKDQLDIRQILVEFHHRFPEYDKHDTEKSVNKLNKAGYKIFHISDVGIEYSFIRG